MTSLDPVITTSANSPIVVGLDTSERAPAVLGAAMAQARASGGKLVLVRAVPLPVDFSTEGLIAPPLDLTTTLQEEATRDLHRFAASVPAEYMQAEEVRIGVPWQVVVDEAKEMGAQLIVIGSHGFAGLDHILGTTAAKVVNHAPCSTLVVR